MKRLTTLAVFALCAIFVANVTFAAGTLYQQEGGTNDQDTIEVDGAGSKPSGMTNMDNWVYQYGSGSWTGIYADGDGWMTFEESGDMLLEVEADVEMYFTQEISNNKVYFHIGNIYAATEDDLTAIVPGSFTSNNGQYIGVSFQGTTKDDTSFEKDTGGDYTGVIVDGMQSDHDSWRDQDNQMDVEITLNWGAGWTAPVNYGNGAHDTVTDTLWWLVDGGGAGSYSYNWRIRLMPEADQADGDYYLDPAIVSAPVL